MRREDVDLGVRLNNTNSYIFCRFLDKNQVVLTCYCVFVVTALRGLIFFIGLYGGQVLQVG
jgi:hypothetical protein